MNLASLHADLGRVAEALAALHSSFLGPLGNGALRKTCGLTQGHLARTQGRIARSLFFH